MYMGVSCIDRCESNIAVPDAKKAKWEGEGGCYGGYRVQRHPRDKIMGSKDMNM